jgi:hypothetical protein
MNNLAVDNNYTTEREDGQVCPVGIETDKSTGETKAQVRQRQNRRAHHFFLGTNRIIKPKCNWRYKNQLLTQY